MSRRSSLCLAILAVAGVVLGLAAATAKDTAKAGLKDQQGADVGTVTLQQTPNGTLLHAELRGLPAGTHAFHVHGTGLCDVPFKSAGGHYNPDGRMHGILNPDGPHAGDLPNIHVPASGVLDFEVLAVAVDLDDKLFDADGAAIVIHEGPDDYQSDPAGAAGPRIACGVIE